MESFFMVFVENNHSPAVKHEQLENAVQEAERLCKKTGAAHVYHEGGCSLHAHGHMGNNGRQYGQTI